MAMIYTLITSAKEWLSDKYGNDAAADNDENNTAKDEVSYCRHKLLNFFSCFWPLII